VDEALQTPSPRAKSKPIGESGRPLFEFSKYVMPNFELSKFEIPSEFRGLAEKSASQAKETCEKMKTATEEMTDRFKDAYTAVTKGAADYGARLIEATRTNTGTAFDYAINLLAAKSLPEVVELSTTHLHKQFDALTKQSNDLTAIAQKVANETAEPMKDGITKAFRKAA
jgi:phasin